METTECPVCDRKYHVEEIEHHVNNCLFLNSNTDSLSTRKRLENQASPRPTKLARRSPGAVNIAKKRSSFVSSDIDTVPKPTTSSHSSTCDTAPVSKVRKIWSWRSRLATFYNILIHFLGRGQNSWKKNIFLRCSLSRSLKTVSSRRFCWTRTDCRSWFHYAQVAGWCFDSQRNFMGTSRLRKSMYVSES